MLPTAILRNQLFGGVNLPCSFYRGGTSKGLIFSTSNLACFDHATRDRIICRAMGSPDPDKRQIDGLGGGISSLSKTAIVGPPDSALAAKLQSSRISFHDGVEYADDETLASSSEKGWDLVYRFGQVPVEEGTEIDWTSTCGNLVSAVALFGLHQGHVKQDRIHQVFEELQGIKAKDGDKFAFPVRLLVTCSGQIIRANVPVTLYSTQNSGHWYPDLEGDHTISGVPGSAPGILIETPLDTSSLLPTGNQLDTVTVENVPYPVTIINAGLPTIFVSSSSLTSVLDPAQLPSLSPSDLDSNIALMTLLDKLRVASSALTPFLQKTLSPSAPKICIVHPTPASGYRTTGGTQVESQEMNLLIRAVSVGNLHRTVPATCLSALAAGRAFPKSTIERAVRAGQSKAQEKGQGQILSIRVGQPAGVSEASVKVRPATDSELEKGVEQVPESIVYYRTARRIIEGFVDVPHSMISS
ncbi:Methylitaconate delta2-delta3-isomerase [Pseudozyma hubeiensis]|nr:Methylitaconate delta2-delta3-isomerase [Pseudozyma hubeiensis]